MSDQHDDLAYAGPVDGGEVEWLRNVSQWHAVGSEHGLVALFLREQDALEYCEKHGQLSLLGGEEE